MAFSKAKPRNEAERRKVAKRLREKYPQMYDKQGRKKDKYFGEPNLRGRSLRQYRAMSAEGQDEMDKRVGRKKK